MSDLVGSLAAPGNQIHHPKVALHLLERAEPHRVGTNFAGGFFCCGWRLVSNVFNMGLAALGGPMVSGADGGESGTEAFPDGSGSSSNSDSRFEFGVLGLTAVGGSWLSKASASRMGPSSVGRLVGGLSGEVGRQGEAALLQSSVGEREWQCSSGCGGDDSAFEVVGA